MTCRCLPHLLVSLFLVPWFGGGLLAPQHVLAQDESTDQDFVPMFQGESFNGWVRTNTPQETWSFQDGLLVCSGKPIGEIRTERMYQNFVMELEWRHMVPGGNAGVFIWADDITSRGVPFHRGIEVQVLENAYGDGQGHTTHGDIFPIHGATMTPINGRGGSRAFPTENRSNPSPDWNHYRIECVDGAIALAVNGKVVTRGKDCVPRKGYICLESEGGVVHYRNLRIRELPASEIAPEHVAIASRDYRSIYSGLDLNGWVASDDGKWSPNDWVLSYQGDAEHPGQLTSNESVRNIGLVVDVRFKEPTSGAVIEAGPGIRIDLRTEPFASLLEPDGRWNRIEAVTTDGTTSIEVNGTAVPAVGVGNARASDEASSLTLRPSGSVDFCNLYIRAGREAATPGGLR